MNRKKILLFIICITILTRVYHITFPLIGWQSWRQTDTASIAKNFFQNGYNIFYPQIEWRGNTAGYVESEFHIYPFIVSLLYGIFGMDEMWGRIVSLIFSVLTVYGLYLLVRKIISENTALWSAFIYAILPLNIYFTRAFMPESMMLMCSVYGIYFYNEWIENDRWKNFTLSLLFIALAVLIKLPALYLGLPLLYLTINKFGKSFLTNPKIWLYSILVFVPAILWYYHSHQLYDQTGLTFGIWNAGKDKWGMIEPLLTIKFYNDIFFKSIAERHLTYAGFIVFIWGLFLKRQHPKEKLFDWWLISVVVFIFIAPQANTAQEYYQLPLNVPAAVFIGKIFSEYFSFGSLKASFVKNKFASVFLSLCLTGIIVLSFLRMGNFMKSENYNAPVFKFIEDIHSNIPKEDLVVTVTEGNPTILYLSERRGWASNPDDISDKFINDMREKGGKYIISEKNMFHTEKQNEVLQNLLKNYEVVENTDDYIIIKIN
ncbi:MAG: glycosyltransferase family 39 protein [Ignavibacteria bacterium]